MTLMPNNYELKNDVTEKQILYNGFTKKTDYYFLKRNLYGNFIILSLFIKREDGDLVICVHDNNDYPYDQFYHYKKRNDDYIYKQVIKEYNNFMEKLVAKNILERTGKEIMTNTTVTIKKINDKVNIPTRGSEYAAGYDLYANCECDVVIPPHETKLIGTGIMAAIPNGYFGGIFARSGLALKENLRPGNCVGVVDSDYRGEIKVALHNDGKQDRIITNGERIAQLVIIPYLNVNFEVIDVLDNTERGEGGFGSTGK